MNKNILFSYLYPKGLYDLEKRSKAAGPNSGRSETDNSDEDNTEISLRGQIYDHLRSNPSVSYLKYGKELESALLVNGREEDVQNHIMLIEKILGSISQRLDHSLIVCFDKYNREIKDSVLALGELNLVLSFGHSTHLELPYYIETSQLDKLASSKEDKLQLWKELKEL